MGSPPVPTIAGRAGLHPQRIRDETPVRARGALRDAEGKWRAPVDVVLETDSRKPSAKHEILEMYVQHGLVLPDTPTMALHRGRIDRLEEHLRRDPGLLRADVLARGDLSAGAGLPRRDARDPWDAAGRGHAPPHVRRLR